MASTCNHQRACINMQVSAASDYRLQDQDQALGEVLDMPGLRNTDAQRKEGQQGIMLVGPGSHDALDVMWAETAGSLQTEVCLQAASAVMLSQIPPTLHPHDALFGPLWSVESAALLPLAAAGDTAVKRPVCLPVLPSVVHQVQPGTATNRRGVASPASCKPHVCCIQHGITRFCQPSRSCRGAEYVLNFIVICNQLGIHPCPASPHASCSCVRFPCKWQHTAWQGLCWCRQASLNVGFGRTLRVPRQLSQGQQASRSTSSHSSTPGPAAMLHFEQVALLPVNLQFASPLCFKALDLQTQEQSAHCRLNPAEPCLQTHNCSAGRCCVHMESACPAMCRQKPPGGACMCCKVPHQLSTWRYHVYT